jgi:hypothetical protein
MTAKLRYRRCERPGCDGRVPLLAERCPTCGGWGRPGGPGGRWARARLTSRGAHKAAQAAPEQGELPL